MLVTCQHVKNLHQLHCNIKWEEKNNGRKPNGEGFFFDGGRNLGREGNLKEKRKEKK